MENCLFCKIVMNEIPSEKVFEDDEILVFKDITPQAPVHLLLIPKIHINSPAEIDSSNSEIAGKLISKAAELSKELKLNGYRLVFNCNEIAGQTVFHLHCHMLSGRALNWPPG